MKTIDNINPKTLELDNFDIEKGIKYSLLPGILEDKKFFFTTKDNLVDALNFYSKVSTIRSSYNR